MKGKKGTRSAPRLRRKKGAGVKGYANMAHPGMNNMRRPDRDDKKRRPSPMYFHIT